MGTEGWTNDEAIATWAATPREFSASLDPDGGFAKRHLVNPFLFALLGDIDHQRVLDAGCGQGYLSRLMAERGADVVGVEPAVSLFDYALEREEHLQQGIRYVQADLVALPDLGTFDAVVASMVLCAIPEWRPAMQACVDALRPGGLFVFTLNHPCFEQLATSWQQHGFMKVERYLGEYEIAGTHGTDFHRPLSTYLNELADLGCIVELVEPALPQDALRDREAGPGAEAYLDVPNFVLVAARRKVTHRRHRHTIAVGSRVRVVSDTGTTTITHSGPRPVRPVEFGTTGFYPAFSGAAMAVESEAMGFDIQSFPENHSMVADCFGEMRDAARETTKILLAAGPVNFVTRDPGVVASAVVPLQIISRGRAVCGVASGDSAVAAAGRAPQRHDGLDRDVRMLRTYLHGDDVAVGERTSRIEWADDLSYEPVPIQMVCSGPKSIALAARVTDRICLGVGTNPERVAWALQIIDEGLHESNRDRDDIRIGLFAPLAVTDDRVTGRAAIRTRVAAWAHMSSGRGIDLSEQPEILRRVTSVLRDTYDYRYHRPGVPAENPNSATCDEEFGDWMGIGGPTSYITDRLAQLVDMGVDFFMTALPPSERESFAAEVMPAVRALRATR